MAKVHVFHRKSIVFAGPGGQSAGFHGGFWDQWGSRGPVGPLSTLRFGGGKLMFWGFEGTEDGQPITQGTMSTKKVALRAHVAKVHVFRRKSMVFAAPGGQSACFHEGFWDQWGCRLTVGPLSNLRLAGGKLRFFLI